MGKKSRHVSPQTDPTVGLFRNMSRFFRYILQVTTFQRVVLRWGREEYGIRLFDMFKLVTLEKLKKIQNSVASLSI